MPRRAGLALLLLLPTAANAALSGYYDSIEQITAILNSESVAEQLGPWPIVSVEQSTTATDAAAQWIIRTQGCSLTVALAAEPPEDGMIGKTTYRAEPLGTCE